MNYYFLVIFLFFLFGCKNKPKKQTDNYVIPAENSTKKMTSIDQSVARGKDIYIQFCLRCHMPNGEGMTSIYPPLTDSDWLLEKRKASIHAVKYGLSGKIEVNGKTYNNVMPMLGLSDQEVADVLNYVMTSWGNIQKTPITQEEVSHIVE